MPVKDHGFEVHPLAPLSSTSEVRGTFFRPVALSNRSPGVVYCPGGRDELGAMAWLPEACADRGYPTLAVEYRGDIWDGDDGDVIAAIDALAADDDVDGERIAIVGHFRGGMSALRTAASDSRVRSVVALNTPTFLAQWVADVQPFSSIIHDERVAMAGGLPEDDPTRFRNLSPLFCAARIKAPVLLVHGTAARYVPVDHALWMYIQLGHTGNPKVRLEMPFWAGHWFEDVTTGRFDVSSGLRGTFRQHVSSLVTNWLDDTLGREY